MRAQVTQIQSLNRMSSREYVIHYLRSLERFKSHVVNNRLPGDNVRNESLAWGAFGECMFWFKGLYEHTVYFKKGKFDDQELCEAFRELRNLAQHAGCFPIATTISIGPSGQVNTWHWGVPTSKLRSGNSTPKNYTKRLQGQEVLATLELLAQEVWKVRGWTISKDEISQPGYTVESSLKFDNPATSAERRIRQLISAMKQQIAKGIEYLNLHRRP